MLVLTRKLKQAIVIRDDIEITVMAIAGDMVRLGISSPRDIPVLRKEIYLKVESPASRAAAIAPGGVRSS